MQVGLLNGSADVERPPPTQRRMRLRGGEGEEVAGMGFVGCCCFLLVVLPGLMLSSLEPNEYGIKINTFTGTVQHECYRGGLYLTGPLISFIKFPAAQVNLEFSSASRDRPPVQTRTGADVDDADSGGQPIAISCSFQYQYVQSNISQLYLSLGSPDNARQRIELLAWNMVGNTAQDFTPPDFWQRRDQIAAKMVQAINHTLWTQVGVVVVEFQIMKVDFAQKFEDSITAVQVAEQMKVVNEYEQQVAVVVQSIEVARYHNMANIANISAGAQRTSKEISARAKRDAFDLKQGMKAKKYQELQQELGFDSKQMGEYFKIKAVQGQTESSGKVVVGMPGIGDVR